jgi:hypothetical protein
MLHQPYLVAVENSLEQYEQLVTKQFAPNPTLREKKSLDI